MIIRDKLKHKQDKKKGAGASSETPAAEEEIPDDDDDDEGDDEPDTADAADEPETDAATRLKSLVTVENAKFKTSRRPCPAKSCFRVPGERRNCSAA